MFATLEDEGLAQSLDSILNIFLLILLVVLFPICFFLNIITIIVFMRKKFSENSMGFFNITINIVNNLIILLNIGLYYKDSKNEFVIFRTTFACFYLYIVRIFSSFHSWVIVMVSFERALHVIFPFKFKFMKKKKILFGIIIAIFTANIVFNIPNVFLRLTTTITYSNQTNQTITTKMCASTPQIEFIIDTIRILTRMVIPFILVALTDFLLIYKLFKSKSKVAGNSY